MGMEFGWWDRDEEGVKWQISARFHGGKVEIDVGSDDELSFTYSPLPPSKLKKRQEEIEPA